jgi:D-glycero-alpha-D-manno-heptose-7-phosphate kinase
VIVAKTPLRIPLAGGLTDLKPYAMQFGGVTVSATIDKYVYVALKKNLDGIFDLKYQDVHEKSSRAESLRHSLTREALRLTGLDQTPLQITIMVDLASESGLGSSGAVTVSLLHAMHAFKGESVSRQQLLEEASHIEVDILEGASGYHDPSICALGGLKLIEYRGSDISARDIPLRPETKRAFADSLLFFYSGRHAKSKPSLDLLSSHMLTAHQTMHQIKRLGYELEQAFLGGDLQRIAEIIGEQQELKEQLPGKFVDDYVKDVTRRVREVGAYAQLPGGKISAFVIVCCPGNQHEAVRRALPDLREVELGLETGGTQVTAI